MTDKASSWWAHSFFFLLALHAHWRRELLFASLVNVDVTSYVMADVAKTVCLKTFGTRSYKLCTKVWYAIIKLTRETPNLAINKCNEVHCACHHKPQFHRFDHSENANPNSSTDESGRMKGLQQPSSTTSMGSTGSNNTLSSVKDSREEPMRGPEDPVPSYWETWSHSLCAHSLLTTKELDLPQVESNLNKSPQEYLVVSVECIEV
jgi:hypothetical protein